MFRRFLYGRYGNDQLNYAILVFSLIVGLLSMFIGGYAGLALTLMQLVSLAFWAFRAFSKNHYKRRKENDAFMRFWGKLKNSFRGVSSFFARLKDRKHKYFKCPLCKSRLRVPRGRGSITVTCPRCKHRFDEKS